MLPPIFTAVKLGLVDKNDKGYITNIGGEISSYWFTVIYSKGEYFPKQMPRDIPNSRIIISVWTKQLCN